ncbi:protein RD3-like [Chiloscyllium plagiosum]|uniref:protein RD3-like n=1 Tax=Chiloscyllium plagiosum TaxID=36176 RepID=UPI001CB82CAA|nr:protein RD3-like [Chiloscyllium plagiosum]
MSKRKQIDRCQEVSVRTELVPQKLINTLKQALQDSINNAEESEQQSVKQQWTKTYATKNKTVYEYKEEIPTISSYVDKSQHNIQPTVVEKIRNLPQCYSSNNIDSK